MSRTKRIIAAFFALLMLSESILPTAAYALSSGPSQPEVQGFQPAGVNDMVNLFTGDFSYNIPLLDVEGYPVNLFYNAGIGMDQEASWVGLGWNLNPGVVERNLRGLPDDFNGDLITREMGLRPNRTFGLSFEVGNELFGKDILDELGNVTGHQGGQISIGVSPSFNNYYGPDFEFSAGVSLRSTTTNISSMNCGLGLRSSANRGLTISPTIGFDREFSNLRKKAGLNFGLSLSSMQGMTNASFGANLRSSKKPKKEDANVVNGNNQINTWHGIARMNSSFDLGSPTYSPEVTLPMENFSVSLGVTWPLTVPPMNHPNFTLGGFYSQQKLATNNVSRSAYGYLHLGNGQGLPDALLDFNREKDGPYSEDRAGLGLASLTNDIFSVSGQGVSGSYRAFRSEVGHVFDPHNSSGGAGWSLGGEVGAGTGFHLGGDQVINYSLSASGDWSTGNLTGTVLNYRATGHADQELVFFREANEAVVEQDSSLWLAYGQDRPVQLELVGPRGNGYELGKKFMHGNGEVPEINYRQKREPRAQLFSYLNHRNAMYLGLDMPISHTDPRLSTIPDHHISEITITGNGGGRYVYGVPTYNISQKDVEFSIEKKPKPPLFPNNEIPSGSGLVVYNSHDVSIYNKKGRDHYYSCTTTPPYAYAFLLSAVLSPDYSDVDEIRGPSDGDLGNYTRFTYSSPSNAFQWRTPAAPGVARWNKGLHGDSSDDKASYVWGEKEVRYLTAIESRNFIAIFHHAAREDAKGVNEDGSLSNAVSQKLDSISLYPKIAFSEDPDIAPITRVHFAYDYSLCPNTPTSTAAGNGKLTLRRVWFSHGNSQRGVTTPYVFSYGTGPIGNPAYDMRAQDRWGNYKPESTLPNEEFPYAEQVHADADANAGAWNLKTITTPSGGIISVEYEADDYAYVQDKPAMRMLKLSAFMPSGMPGLRGEGRLLFDLPIECSGMSDPNAIKEALFGGIYNLYFRSYVQINNVPGHSKWDYVSGYARIYDVTIDVTNQTGWVDLRAEPIDEGSPSTVNPIYRAALEFMRLHYPTLVHPGSPILNDDVVVGASWLAAMVNSVVGFIGQIGAFFQGPNATLGGHAAFCSTADPQRSWIRVNEPDRMKKGGGHRVKSIRISDNWENMEAQEASKTFTYGQDYVYGDQGGSYGVAAYEPMSGADENPWRQPTYGIRETGPLTPDERSYQELPFGESLFPSPVVGYSKVVVTDHYPNAQARIAHGTGRVEHEFHTAKDFPTVTRMTSISPGGRVNPKWSIGSLTRLRVIDHMHATQGYVVETNDMHGKPKSVAVFPEGAGPEDAVEVTRYNYARTGGGTGGLSNTATVINPQGEVSRATIGRQYEFVADNREFISKGSSVGVMLNLEGVPIPFLPFLPIVLPKYASSSTIFKSSVLVKKVHRFGQLQSVTQVSHGSVVTTENLAYDSQTGKVLLTRVNNGFDDPVYSLHFPAYWHYEGMGPAYKNMGVHMQLALNAQGRAEVVDAAKYFFPGDELALGTAAGTPPSERGWVDQVEPGRIRVVDRTGQPVQGSRSAVVVRSGRRNMQGVDMMTLTLQRNPLETLASNVYAGILNAEAREFNGQWRAECACMDPEEPRLNDWLMNRKGAWRLWKEDAWLTERTRSIYDNNTDIRRDGAYTSFSPLYKVNNGQWGKDKAGWTTAREVMDYNARGQELEQQDALGLYSAALFGLGGNHAIALARNARRTELLSLNFEEGSATGDCISAWEFEGAPDAIQQGVAHSGRYGIKVTGSSPATITAKVVACPAWNCQIQLAPSLIGDGAPLSHIVVTATGGLPPYSFTLEIHGGDDSDVQYQLVGDDSVDLVWTDGTPANFPVELRVTDRAGCRTVLKWPAP